MPWVRATLRGQRIYARAGADGKLAIEGGKVEVRYKPNDGRMYQAMAANLTGVEAQLLPDDTCGPASKPEPKASGSGEAGGTAGTAKKVAAKRTKSTTGSGPPAPVAAGSLVAYTDGACTGNPGPAGVGVVVLLPTGRVEISEYLGEGTNNIAELTAVWRAVQEAAALDAPLVVHTDSQYAIGVLSKGWKAKANTELIMAIRETLRTRGKTSFVYVRGHSGIPLNERCDELAREAIKTRVTQRKLV